MVSKIVCGDKSDNIFPLIRWFVGSRKYSISENMLDKAIDNMEKISNTKIKYSDILDKILKRDNDFLISFIKNLIGVSKDNSNPDEKEILRHLYHNFKLIYIKGNIPENRVDEFMTLQKNININFDKKISVEKLSEILQPETEILNDAATEIMLKSLL